MSMIHINIHRIKTTDEITYESYDSGCGCCADYKVISQAEVLAEIDEAIKELTELREKVKQGEG